MRILMFDKDEGGLHTYSNFLVAAMKKQGINLIHTNKPKHHKYDILHIQFENSLFHPFGMGIFPLLVKNKIKGKKIVLTMHTVSKKKEVYARNSAIALLKRSFLPLVNFFIGKFSDKVIVHRKNLKDVLVREYGISQDKVEVIPHGTY